MSIIFPTAKEMLNELIPKFKTFIIEELGAEADSVNTSTDIFENTELLGAYRNVRVLVGDSNIS